MLPIGLGMALISTWMSPSRPFQVQHLGSLSGRTVRIRLDGRKVETTFAGKLKFRDQRGVWTSVCGAVRVPVGRGQTGSAQAYHSMFLPPNYRRAGAIVAKCFASALSADQCAGLQLAVWEAIEDGGERPNFQSGHFQALANPAVLSFAQQYYQTPPSATATDTLVVEVNKGRTQTQLVPIPPGQAISK